MKLLKTFWIRIRPDLNLKIRSGSGPPFVFKSSSLLKKTKSYILKPDRITQVSATF